LLMARQERDNCEKRLYRLMQRLEESEKALSNHHAERGEYKAKEAESWDQHSEIRLQGKEVAAAGNVEEKKRLDAQLRGIQSIAWATTDVSIDTVVKNIASQRCQVDTLQSQIGSMSEKIEDLIIESSSICPKPCFDLLPSHPTSMDKIKLDFPCACCKHFFADQACVPMSCGCIFHPHCMFKTVLAAHAECPK
jgi:uncharacterized coiled-coil protein SlyX